MNAWFSEENEFQTAPEPYWNSLRVAQLAGKAFAVLMTLFVLADLVMRPKFVPIYAGAEDMTREPPAALSAAHFVMNLLMPAILVVQTFFVRVDLRRSLWIGCIAAALILVTIASTFANPYFKSLIYIVILALTLGGDALWVSADSAKAGLRAMLQWTAAGLLGVLILALMYNEYRYGRFVSRAGPNYWGMIAFTTAMLSLTWHQRRMRYVCVAIAILVLILSQARGSLIGFAVGGACYCLIRFVHSEARYRGWYLAGLGLAFPLVPLVFPIIADKLLLLSDSRRGETSGGSGRVGAWGEALDAFSSHPFFGVGYRQHETYITVASNAHNAYLATITELGAGGLIAYLFLVFGGLWRAGALAFSHDSRLYAAMFCFLAGFSIIGFVEYQGLATGSPMPLIMMAIASHAWSKDPQAKKVTGAVLKWRRHTQSGLV